MAIKPLAEEIRRLRKELGWSMRQAAEYYGVNKRTWENWEQEGRAEEPPLWGARLMIRDLKNLLEGKDMAFRAYLNACSAVTEDKMNEAQTEVEVAEAEAEGALLLAIRDAHFKIYG